MTTVWSDTKIRSVPAELRLRPIMPADAAMIFSWRNLPVIVELGSSQREVSWGEHESWFAESLHGDKRAVFVVLADEEPAGQIRFDWVGVEEAEISIYLLPAFTGRGLGVRAILQGCDCVWKTTHARRRVSAWVRRENTRSLSAFRKAGFLPEDDQGRAGHVRFTLERDAGGTSR